MAHCAPQQLQNSGSTGSLRCLSYGATIITAYGTCNASARRHHLTAASPPLCLCHLFRAPCDPAPQTTRTLKESGLLSPGEWPFCARGCRRAASVKGAIPRRAADCGTIATEQDLASSAPLMSGLSHSATIRLGSTPSVVLPSVVTPNAPVINNLPHMPTHMDRNLATAIQDEQQQAFSDSLGRASMGIQTQGAAPAAAAAVEVDAALPQYPRLSGGGASAAVATAKRTRHTLGDTRAAPRLPAGSSVSVTTLAQAPKSSLLSIPNLQDNHYHRDQHQTLLQSRRWPSAEPAPTFVRRSWSASSVTAASEMPASSTAIAVREDGMAVSAEQQNATASQSHLGVGTGGATSSAGQPEVRRLQMQRRKNESTNISLKLTTQDVTGTGQCDEMLGSQALKAGMSRGSRRDGCGNNAHTHANGQVRSILSSGLPHGTPSSPASAASVAATVVRDGRRGFKQSRAGLHSQQSTPAVVTDAAETPTGDFGGVTGTLQTQGRACSQPSLRQEPGGLSASSGSSMAEDGPRQARQHQNQQTLREQWFQRSRPTSKMLEEKGSRCGAKPTKPAGIELAAERAESQPRVSASQHGDSLCRSAIEPVQGLLQVRYEATSLNCASLAARHGVTNSTVKTARGEPHPQAALGKSLRPHVKGSKGRRLLERQTWPRRQQKEKQKDLAPKQQVGMVVTDAKDGRAQESLVAAAAPAAAAAAAIVSVRTGHTDVALADGTPKTSVGSGMRSSPQEPTVVVVAPLVPRASAAHRLPNGHTPEDRGASECESATESESDFCEPSTSYDSSAVSLASSPSGWRRRRLVRLFPVPRPHRRKRRALARAAAAATAAPDGDGGGGPCVEKGKSGIRRTHEFFSFPFTVSRTSDVPICFGQLLTDPPLQSPSSSLAALPPLLQAQLQDAPRQRLALGDDAAKRSPPIDDVMGPSPQAYVASAGSGRLSRMVVEPEWLDVPVKDDPHAPGVAPGSRQSAGTRLDPGTGASPAAAALSAQSSAWPPPPPPGPLVQAAAHHPSASAYSLLSAPSFVLFAEAIPEHRVLVYRHGPVARWCWQPLLRVTSANCLGKNLLAIAVPAMPAVAASIGPLTVDTPPMAEDGICPEPTTLSVSGSSSDVVPLEFFLVAQPPEGIPLADTGDGDNAPSLGSAGRHELRSEALPSPKGSPEVGMHREKRMDPSSTTTGATRATVARRISDTNSKKLHDGSSSGRKGFLSCNSMVSVQSNMTAAATKSWTIPQPSLVLTRPGHYLISLSSIHGSQRDASPRLRVIGSRAANGNSSNVTHVGGSRGNGLKVRGQKVVGKDGSQVPGTAIAAAAADVTADIASPSLAAQRVAAAAAAAQVPPGSVAQAIAGSVADVAAPVKTPLTPLCPPSIDTVASEVSRLKLVQKPLAAVTGPDGDHAARSPGSTTTGSPAPAPIYLGRRLVAHPVLRHGIALVLDGSSMMGWRGRDWEASALQLRRLWESSQRVRPGLLVLATSRTMKSVQQEWLDKQAYLPVPDVMLLAMGTEVMYRIPAAMAAARGQAQGDAAGVSAACWQLDEQWSELLERSFDAAAMHRAVEAVVQQYSSVRFASPVQSPSQSLLPDASSQAPPCPVAGNELSATAAAAAAVEDQPKARIPGVSRNDAATSLPSMAQRHCTARSGRPAVSYGLGKLQGRHMICLEVYTSLADRVVRDIRERLRAHSLLIKGRGQQDPVTAVEAVTGRVSNSTANVAVGAVSAAVHFEIQPRGSHGEWSTLYVLPAAAGKAAALRHVMQRFSIDASAVVAAGDTNRDAELLAVAAAAVVTTNRPSPALRQLMLINGGTSASTVTHNLTQSPPPPPATPAQLSEVAAITEYKGLRADTLELGGDGEHGANNGGCGSGRTLIVQSGKRGPAGVLEGLRLLELL